MRLPSLRRAPTQPYLFSSPNAVLAVVASLALALAACGSSQDRPVITQARIGAPTGPNAALYFTAAGYGTADALVGGSTDAAVEVQLHETVQGEDGSMAMRAVRSLDLPARGEMVLAPGGYHLMLIDADRLEVGETVDVSLIWEAAGEMTIQAEVVEPAATMDDPTGGGNGP